MSVKLLTEHHLEFLSSKEAALAGLSLHLSKCHIVGNHVSRPIFNAKHMSFKQKRVNLRLHASLRATLSFSSL